MHAGNAHQLTDTVALLTYHRPGLRHRSGRHSKHQYGAGLSGATNQEASRHGSGTKKKHSSPVREN
jgi:hypothetical protein